MINSLKENHTKKMQENSKISKKEIETYKQSVLENFNESL